MSRYNNVVTLLDITEDYDQQKIVELLLDEDWDTDSLAEDIAFVIISLWGMCPKEKQQAFRERLTDEIVNFEIESMFKNDQ